MHSSKELRLMHRKAAAEAAKKGRIPYAIESEDLQSADDFLSYMKNLPDLADASRHRLWKKVDASLFCDKMGTGNFMFAIPGMATPMTQAMSYISFNELYEVVGSMAAKFPTLSFGFGTIEFVGPVGIVGVYVKRIKRQKK